ncbi:hypothetical protein [Goodfellowiella coeruleoviolacea]|uniref:Uncharacterized protein n=1 Tax=Goodfellowiella coeruleoviolacea TaxID=334858 RepID=A0AAE3GJ45_9PSEU|nr:hypothetical protein [Goodfellowiella coeruleoviolacea]MCP2167083.1 hypothetical protein [Goodfellowiella coeruleoviolacea]
MTTQRGEAPDCISLGGTASLFTLTENSGIGAITGTIDGAAYGENTSELTSVGAHSFEYTMYHVFLDKDGSTLRTQDRAVLRTSTEDGASLLEVEYTVVEGTGRFTGYEGTFRSRGWLSTPEGKDAIAQHAVGVVRFAGTICRA